MRRYTPFYLALAGAAAAAIAALWLAPELAIQLAANAFFLVYIVMECIKIRTLSPDFLREHAAANDAPAWTIIVVGFVAVVVAVSSLFLLVNRGRASGLELTLSLASVALGWLTIHWMAAMHYAHLYWRPDSGASVAGSREPHGGLDFPGDDEPGGFDFLYFALVIGMTAQTSDVAITRSRMRRLATLHGAVSFLFNTVLVAAAVNVAVSLAG